MKARTMLLLGALCAGVPGLAEDWPALPPDVWSITEAPAKGMRGALVLEEKIQLSRTGVTQSYRVLILSEAGKAAAEFKDFPKETEKFAGRVVYPDGKVLEFNSTKDFVKKTLASQGDSTVERTRIVAPGLSAHCVVDVRWSFPRDFSVEKYRTYRTGIRWRLINPFPTRRMVFELPSRFPLSMNLEQFPGQTAAVSESGGVKTFTWTNLPGEEEIPYCLAVARPAPIISLYQTPEVLRFGDSKGPAEYWDAYALYGVKPSFEYSPEKGSEYKALLKELSQDLPPEPQAKARELMVRLVSRIRNRHALTHAEKAAMTPAQLEDKLEASDLKATIKRQYTDSFGMLVLYYHLLKDSGIPPKLLLVTDRDARLFNFQLKDYQQFSDWLVTVPEEGKPPLILDPGMRFAPPGLVLPDYQGVPALEIDSATWTAKLVAMGFQPPSANQRRYKYTLDLQEEEDVFSLSADFMGYPEFVEKGRYVRLEASEQQRKLKESLEENSRSFAITKAEVGQAPGPKDPFRWSVEGRIERSPGRRREVVPFPAMTSPVWVPQDLPAERTQTIVVPYARIHTATSTFSVPRGYRLAPVQDLHQRNPFGRVDWTLDTGMDKGLVTVTVTLRVELGLAMAKPLAYPALLEYLKWVQEASGRTLILEKI